MIINKTPLSMVQVQAYIDDLEDKKVVQDYLKDFVKVKKEDAEKIIKEVRDLNNPKVKEEHLVKIVDFLPQDVEDVNKIFIDVILSEEEANAILNIVKKY